MSAHFALVAGGLTERRRKPPRERTMLDLILPVSYHEYQQMIFLAQVFGVIAIAAIIGAILRPEEW